MFSLSWIHKKNLSRTAGIFEISSKQARLGLWTVVNSPVAWHLSPHLGVGWSGNRDRQGLWDHDLPVFGVCISFSPSKQFVCFVNEVLACLQCSLTHVRDYCALWMRSFSIACNAPPQSKGDLCFVKEFLCLQQDSLIVLVYLCSVCNCAKTFLRSKFSYLHFFQPHP